MQLFFDTSAVVPILIKEPGSRMARAAFSSGEVLFAWKWMRVEAEAALVRRKADAVTWRNWRSLERSFTWLDFIDLEIPELCAFNRQLGLRAADAGHLFVFEKATAALPEIQLVTFDKEMAAAARLLGLSIHSLHRDDAQHGSD